MMFTYEFKTTPRLRNRPRTVCHVTEVSYQRNGVSGEGFHQVQFVTDEFVTLMGIVFEASKYVAVINPFDTESHWRGDNFEDGLRETAKAWDDSR